MQGLIDLLNRLGPARIASMAAVTLALVGFFAFVMMRMSQPAMTVLYADLQTTDSNGIIRELESRNIKYELRDEGRTILAPKDAVTRLRMDLAAKGLPTGGSVGYEIFDKGDAFSATSFVQGVNALRALEGELARTIRSINRVQSARVHLALPERRLFERDREQPRASIVLKVTGELEPGQVRAIRHLVASAVEGLKPDRISIVDESGRLLADGAQSDPGGTVAADEKQAAFERRLRSQVEEIVASVVGQGRTRVQVSAEMDVNRVQQTSESYDPESRVVRSTQTRNETAQTTEGNGQVTVGNELPAANNANAQQQQREQTQKSEEVINYEISRTTRTEVVEGGRVKRLSVAVLVDGVYARSAAGEVTYQPRPQEELDRIAALVRSSIGFDPRRGDQIEVVNLRFAEPPLATAAAASEGLIAQFMPTKHDILRLIELAVLAVLTLIVLLLVVRPMVRTILAQQAGARGRGEAAQPAATGEIAGPSGAGGTSASLPAGAIVETEAGRMMELARVNGQVQARSIERIGEIVKENPAATATIIRQWIHEAG